MSKAQRKVAWRMASSIPGTQEFIRNIIGKKGSMKRKFLKYTQVYRFDFGI